MLVGPNNAIVYMRLGEDNSKDYIELRGQTFTGGVYLVGQKVKHKSNSIASEAEYYLPD